MSNEGIDAGRSRNVEEHLRFAPDTGDHWRRLKQDVERHLASCNDHSKANTGHLVGSFLFFAVAIVAWVGLLAFGAHCVFLAYAVFSLASMLLAVNVMHDSVHNALFRSVRMNRVAMWAASIPLGLDADIWAVRHVRYHHPYANIDGQDLDIEPNPLLRQTPFQGWAPRFRWQHLYWPIVAAISLPYLSWYLDWMDQAGRTRLATEPRLRCAGRWGCFLATKGLHAGLVLGLPWYWLGQAGVSGWNVLGAYLLGQMFASAVVVALILGTHWAETEFFTVPGNRQLRHTWYEHALRTACDWVPAPRWLDRFMGGLNWHATHHLFPGYNHRHYPRLATIIACWAKEAELPYRCLSYRDLMASQRRFLKSMGERP